MHKFVQELVNGLTTGSLYALIALGYSMVYGILKLLNFATATCSWSGRSSATS